MESADLAVIGAGPAGLAAAGAGAAAGASVALIEDHPAPGGKVLGADSGRRRATAVERHEQKIRRRLLAGLEHPKIRTFFRHQAWHVEDGFRVFVAPVGGAGKGGGAVSCRSIVLAGGAMERTLPFPGWTLPNVFTLGGLNGLAKHGVLPGQRVVVAGSGPLLVALAHNLMAVGAQVVALVSMSPATAPFRFALPLAATMGPYKAFQGIFVAGRLAARRIPVFHSSVVTAVRGGGRVESATVARIDGRGRTIPGSQRSFRADAVAVGYGLIPSLDLSRLCGCDDIYDPERGYWRPVRDRNLGTRAEGVYAAGDGAGIKGYAAAVIEGRLAGTTAAARLGFGRPDPGMLLRWTRTIQKAQAFGRILDLLSKPPAGLYDQIPDDTVVCRCEEVTLGDLRRAAAHGSRDIDDLKRRTRMGMGQCQGRFCGQVANELLWGLTGTVRDRERFTSRIPARPLAMENLL